MKKEQKLKELLEDIVSIMDGPVRESAQEALRLADEMTTQDKQQAVTYDIGQRFLYTPAVDEYILARVGRNEVMLINLSNGRRWSEGVEVRFPHLMVSEKEFKEITSYEVEYFKPIK